MAGPGAAAGHSLPGHSRLAWPEAANLSLPVSSCFEGLPACPACAGLPWDRKPQWGLPEAQVQDYRVQGFRIWDWLTACPSCAGLPWEREPHGGLPEAQVQDYRVWGFRIWDWLTACPSCAGLPWERTPHWGLLEVQVQDHRV